MSTTLDIIRIGSEPQKFTPLNKISSTPAMQLTLFNVILCIDNILLSLFSFI
jgi:hypothetical protein